MPVKRTLFVTLPLLICIAAEVACIRSRPVFRAPAAAPAPAQANIIDEIFSRYTEAVGGQAAIDRVTTYKTSGSFETSLAPVRGTFEAWGKNPNKSMSLIRFPRGEVKKGFDGETRWLQTPAGTFSEPGATEMSEVERDAEIYRAGKIKNLYQDLKLENRARLTGREVYVVEGKPAQGPAEKLYFDTNTGLLLRWDMVRKNAKGGHVFVKVHLDDYRDVDGLKVPFKVRFAFESFDLTMRIDELQHNIEIDDAIFKKPSGD